MNQYMLTKIDNTINRICEINENIIFKADKVKVNTKEVEVYYYQSHALQLGTVKVDCKRSLVKLLKESDHFKNRKGEFMIMASVLTASKTGATKIYRKGSLDKLNIMDIQALYVFPRDLLYYVIPGKLSPFLGAVFKEDEDVVMYKDIMQAYWDSNLRITNDNLYMTNTVMFST